MVKKIVIFVIILVGVGGFFLLRKKGAPEVNVSAPAEKALPPSGETLVVYAYSSFTAMWGSGPKLVQKFESSCNCKVELVDVGDSKLIVERLRLEKNNSRADVVIGLDQFNAKEASELIPWRSLSDLKLQFSKDFPKEYQDVKGLAPFDWSPMTFVYRKGEVEPPKKLEDLLDPRWKNSLSLMDPRTSTGGFQFLSWVLKSKGLKEGEAFLRKLKPQIFAVSSSWSSAYGLFKKKQAKMAFSYLTSPVYHWNEEKDQTYQAVRFEQPLPYQVEFVGVPSACKNCLKAREFVDFLLSPQAQTINMESNFMLPVIDGVVGTSAFAQLDASKVVPGWATENSPTEEYLNIWKRVNE